MCGVRTSTITRGVQPLNKYIKLEWEKTWYCTRRTDGEWRVKIRDGARQIMKEWKWLRCWRRKGTESKTENHLMDREKYIDIKRRRTERERWEEWKTDQEEMEEMNVECKIEDRQSKGSDQTQKRGETEKKRGWEWELEGVRYKEGERGEREDDSTIRDFNSLLDWVSPVYMIMSSFNVINLYDTLTHTHTHTAWHPPRLHWSFLFSQIFSAFLYKVKRLVKTCWKFHGHQISWSYHTLFSCGVQYSSCCPILQKHVSQYVLHKLLNPLKKVQSPSLPSCCSNLYDWLSFRRLFCAVLSIQHFTLHSSIGAEMFLCTSVKTQSLTPLGFYLFIFIANCT